MSKTYRLGVIGFAHMHINELMRTFAEVPGVEWVACADTRPSRPELVEARFTRGLEQAPRPRDDRHPRVYDDYREMLDAERFDLVLFCPENARHGEVGEAIAAHGAHLLTEKPMAASLPEALRMARAAPRRGACDGRQLAHHLVARDPHRAPPGARGGHRGRLGGEVAGRLDGPARRTAPPIPGSTARRWRCHDVQKGATWWHHADTGGGALLDYTCYGACLSRYYIGEPATAAFGIKANLLTPYGDADDNAIITVRFPRALAILEATWSCLDHGVPTGPLIYGSEGTLVVERSGGQQVLTLRRGRGQEPEAVPLDPLPEGRDTLGREVIHHLQTGEPLHETLRVDFNLEAMAILDAGIRSAQSGKLELVNGASWSIG